MSIKVSIVKHNYLDIGDNIAGLDIKQYDDYEPVFRKVDTTKKPRVISNTTKDKIDSIIDRVDQFNHIIYDDSEDDEKAAKVDDDKEPEYYYYYYYDYVDPGIDISHELLENNVNSYEPLPTPLALSDTKTSAAIGSNK